MTKVQQNISVALKSTLQDCVVLKIAVYSVILVQSNRRVQKSWKYINL